MQLYGEVITYDGQVIRAFFHSNSGGETATATEVWGGSYPYLQSVETSGEDAYSSYSSEVIFTKDELLEKLKNSYDDIEINYDDENCIEIKEYTDSGRVRSIKFGNKELSRR